MSTIAPTAAAEEAPPTIPQTEPNGAPLLEISTLSERKSIKIDDRFYELRNHDEFGIVDAQTLFAKRKQCAVLVDMDNVTEDQAAQASQAIKDIVQMIAIGIPDDVLPKLGDFKLSQIVEAWHNDAPKRADSGKPEDPTPPPTTPES